jgi:heavy metal sensor kinase
MINSVKNRLALWYGLLVTVLFLLSFYLIYNDLKNYLIFQTDSQLIEKARRSRWFAKDVPLDKIENAIQYNQEIEGSQKVYYILYDPNGKILAQSDSSHWDTFKIDEEKIKKVSLSLNASKWELRNNFPNMKIQSIGEDSYNNLILFESGELSAFPFRLGYIRLNDGKLLVCAQNTIMNEHFLNRLRQTFLILFGIAVVMGGLIGYFLAYKAMSGVKRVTQTAANISDGNLNHRVKVKNDGIEIETLAETFNAMLDKIQVLLSGLKQVSDDIAHDLRTPVTRIRSSAEMSATTTHDEECRCQMGLIVEECDRLVEMINTMLEIAQTDSGARLFDKSQVNLAEIVQRGFDLFHTMAEDKSITYTLNLPETEFIVSGDISRLQRVISNLLDNAIKFTPTGGSIAVEVEKREAWVFLRFKDTGIGIPEDQQERVFDRFYRGDPSRSIDGNGLGLCLARSIIQAHGGSILLESEENNGSCFTVRLPLLNPKLA